VTSRARPTGGVLAPATLLLACLLATGAGGGDGEDGGLPRAHPLERFADTKAGHLLVEIIDAHGTWENWEKIDNIDLTWEWRLYPRPDETEDPVRERVRIDLRGPLRIRVDRPDEQLAFVAAGDELWSLKAGRLPPPRETPESLEALTRNTALFFLLPFNLADPAYDVEYTTETEDDVILTVDLPADAVSRGLTDLKLFADQESHRLRSLLYEFNNQFQVIQLADYRDVDGVQVPFTRITSLAYPNGEPRRILLETAVRKVRFNVFMDESLFTRPPGAENRSWKSRTN
jgi:hypothetical protein